MLFNQFAFLFAFLPAVLCVFFFPGLARFRVTILIVFSLAFYAVSGIEHAMMLILSILWVYAFTYSERIVGNRLILSLAIIGPFLILLYYKYFGFILHDVIDIPNSDDIRREFSLFGDLLLPAGISFFVFQQMAYAIDRFRGEIPDRPSAKRLGLFISFFPQLVAGPIVRYSTVKDAISKIEVFSLNKRDAGIGVTYLMLGLALKVLIADSLARAAEPFLASPGDLGPVTALYVVISYSFRIYFDFYGYSLCAIGIGYFFGFRLPMNFDNPYGALNPQDFWRRWHISLSIWIRDYLYRPLGGRTNYVRNILIVFFLCGLWHGAAWTFAVWGTYHAVWIIAYRYLEPLWDRAPVALQWLTTFTYVSLGWILFIFDFQGAAALVNSLVGFGAPGELAPSAAAWTLVAGAALATFGFRYTGLAEHAFRTTLSARGAAVVYAGLAVAVVLFVDRSQSFVYYRF